jgi:hypothetical protein
VSEHAINTSDTAFFPYGASQAESNLAQNSTNNLKLNVMLKKHFSYLSLLGLLTAYSCQSGSKLAQTPKDHQPAASALKQSIPVESPWLYFGHFPYVTKDGTLSTANLIQDIIQEIHQHRQWRCAIFRWGGGKTGREFLDSERQCQLVAYGPWGSGFGWEDKRNDLFVLIWSQFVEDLGGVHHDQFDHCGNNRENTSASGYAEIINI